MKYEAVIGLEVHVELKTGEKIFCSCPTAFGDEPNRNICPTCSGMPGALPRLSKKAVEFGVRAGALFRCHINERSWFDRKNYYYPDLPKGYQITQHDCPICVGGAVPIETEAGERLIPLERIHLEEDAGKLIHRGEYTFADYNRCGVPLIEIVSLPEMHTAEEAKAYLNSLRRILYYYGISDCKMNEGSLRCDVNVSVRPVSTNELGVKCEIKNVNSVNYVGRAIEDEIERQVSLLESGKEIEPETRRFNEDTGKTERMRKKEGAVDYRYFTEPNLPAVVLSREYIEAVRREVRKSPRDAENELITEYGISRDDAVLLTPTPEVEAYFRRCAEFTEYKTAAANLFVGEVLPKLDADSLTEYIAPESFGKICTLFGDGKIVSSNAKKLIALTAETEDDPIETAEREHYMKITDETVLTRLAESAIKSNEKAVRDYRGGKASAVKQLIGSVMRESRGAADPVAAERILMQLLGE